MRGSSVYSVTRLTGTNYETQAAAATDLGGIEISRRRLVITMGLATITFNPTATAIIIAAGDAKAPIVTKAIEETKNPDNPGSVLQDLENARFYLTKGAASKLSERTYIDFCALPKISDRHVDEIVISLALSLNKALHELTGRDFEENRFSRELIKRTGTPFDQLASATRTRLIAKLEKGLRPVSNTAFLHTEPHHDDIMLGYLAYLYHLVRDPSNHHSFANMTSGFTSVSNLYFLSIIRKLRKHLEGKAFAALLEDGYFDPKDYSKKTEEIYLFLDGTAARMQERKDEAEARRGLRNFVDVVRNV